VLISAFRIAAGIPGRPNDPATRRGCVPPAVRTGRKRCRA